MFLLYKKQSIDLHSKSVDWFLYDGNISRAWIKLFSAFSKIVKYFKLPEQNQPRLGHLAKIGRRKICRGEGRGGRYYEEAHEEIWCHNQFIGKKLFVADYHSNNVILASFLWNKLKSFVVSPDVFLYKITCSY